MNGTWINKPGLIHININLVGGLVAIWNFPRNIGFLIIPMDFHHIFQRGGPTFKPPSSNKHPGLILNLMEHLMKRPLVLGSPPGRPNGPSICWSRAAIPGVLGPRPSDKGSGIPRTRRSSIFSSEFMVTIFFPIRTIFPLFFSTFYHILPTRTHGKS